MSKFKSRFVKGAAGLLAVAFAVILPAATASASIPSGVAASVTCPSGSGTCTEWRYGFYLPGATGQFGVYYTGQWSSSLGSYKIVKVRWVNNTNKTVYWGAYGFDAPYQTGNLQLGIASWESGYGVSAGSSWTYNESSFNGSGKGVYITHNKGAYATTWEAQPGYQYHVAGYSSIPGQFYMG